MDARLCSCGSGLRALRCCELDLATVPPADAAGPLVGQVERAAQSLKGGDRTAAEAILLQVLELVPNEVAALRLLAEIRKPTKPTATEALLRRLLIFLPNDFSAHNELALSLLNRGAVGEAEKHARNTIRLAPENPQSHHLMGMLLTAMNRPQIGEYHYLKAEELLDHRDAMLLNNFAWNLKSQGKMEEGRKLYAEADTLAPGTVHTLLAWAQLEEADRKFPAAGALLDRAEQGAPGHPSILLSRAVLHGRTKTYTDALASLDAIASQRKDSGLGPNELLVKGRLLDQMGRYDEAFAAFEEGKRLLRELSGQQYGQQQAENLVQRLKGFFTSGRMNILPRAQPGNSDSLPQPIFILGFPRSGTTLVEQTLSAHPKISAGDELPFIHDIADVMPRMLNSPLTYPEALAELWMGDHRQALDNLRDFYLQRAGQFGVWSEGRPWFTDKMPLNETHLGLISMVFPRSPLIHVIRHPLDVILSVFSNYLTHGFFCAYSLESAARHYVLIRGLVDHYLDQLKLNYLAIRYEDIVDDQEASVRRMLDFVGVPFDPSCIRFEENQRYARTASYAQVSEKLYSRSRYRYRPYLRHMEPILPILEPVIRKLGYEIEGD